MKKNLILTFFLFIIVLLIAISLILRPDKKVVDKTFKKPVGNSLFELVLPTPTPKETTLAFGGEMIFARTVALKINQAGDYRYPFFYIKPILKKADFRVATLEAPLLGKNQPASIDSMVFQADEENITGLKFADINLVSLAANHIMDAGIEGLNKTIELLDRNNISHIGAGLNKDLAGEPVVKTINGLRFGFLGYNQVPPKEYAASVKTLGSAWLDKKELVSDLDKLRPQVDLLIILCHWGIEYTAYPNEEQKELAYLMIDHGVDLIIGDHPHWIQAIEFYKNKPIFYGLGNFVFDQMWSEQTQKGMVILVTFQNKKLKYLEIAPFRIYDFVQPRPMTGEEKEKMIEYILSLSSSDTKEKLKKYLKPR